jgi:Tat protein secretion system quality control protein TatD with DNase activity
MRGKRNEPAYVTRTAQRVAEVLACDEASVVAATDRNARTLFGLS